MDPGASQAPENGLRSEDVQALRQVKPHLEIRGDPLPFWLLLILIGLYLPVSLLSALLGYREYDD